MMYDCISIGSATQDVFVFSEGAQIHRLQTVHGEHAYLAFDYGSKVMVENLFISVGGGAVNTAIAMSRLGLRTGIICEVGADDAAEMISRALREASVDTAMMVHNAAIHTGYSVIICGFDGDRTVLVHRGAARDLSSAEVDWVRLASTAWIYLGSLTGGSAELWDAIASFAAERGAKLAINPGSAQLQRGLDGLGAVLGVTSVIFVNREEACRLAGMDEWHDEGDEEEAVQRIHAAGCKLVVLTAGKEGARAYDGRDFRFCPAPDVPVVSNLGAGDAFASACVAALHHGLSIDQALRAGAINSGGVVSTMGATEGLSTWDQILARLDT